MPALLATPARPLEDIALPAPKLTPEQIADFAAILGADRVRQDDYERAYHALGRSYHDLLRLRAGDLSVAPDAVIYPRGEDEVVAILKLAAQEKIAVIPYGGGTGRSGGVSAGPGSVTVDLSGMDQVLELDVAAGTALAEAGITDRRWKKRWRRKRHHPGSCRWRIWIFPPWAAGSRAASRSADWLFGCASPRPKACWTPKRDRRRAISPGPVRKAIFGIITKARVKMRPALPPIRRAPFLLPDFAGGAAVLREAAQAGIAPCDCCSLSDEGDADFQHTLAALEEPRGFIQRLKDAWRCAASKSGTALLVIALSR